MKFGKLAVGAVAVLFLAGGQTQSRNDRLSSHLNHSMAEFIAATGWTPTNYYETNEGRVFVVDGPTSVQFKPGYRGTYLKTAPSVATYSCRLLITTKAKNGRGNADSWIIKAIDWRGNC
ncbi:MAG: hypothetical protein ACTHLK_21980 [Brucella intermedia]